MIEAETNMLPPSDALELFTRLIRFVEAGSIFDVTIVTQEHLKSLTGARTVSPSGSRNDTFSFELFDFENILDSKGIPVGNSVRISIIGRLPIVKILTNIDSKLLHVGIDQLDRVLARTWKYNPALHQEWSHPTSSRERGYEYHSISVDAVIYLEYKEPQTLDGFVISAKGK